VLRQAKRKLEIGLPSIELLVPETAKEIQLLCPDVVPERNDGTEI
jgi:hypothetical protein